MLVSVVLLLLLASVVVCVGVAAAAAVNAVKANKYRSGKKSRIFINTWAGFSLGDVQNMSPAVSTNCWSIFERNLVRLVDFAGSKFQRMANWPSFDFFIEAG